MASARGNGASRRRWSVRVRIVSVIVLVAAVGLTASGGVTLLAQRAEVVASVDSRLRTAIAVARSVITASSGSYASNAMAVQAAISRAASGEGESSLGVVAGRAANVPAVAQPFSLTTESALITRVTREVADGTVRLGTYVSGSTQLRYIATPVAVVPGSPAAIYLVAIDLDAATSRLTSGLTTYSSVALITLLAIGLVGWFAAGRLLRPLQTLTDAALAITPTDRTTRIPVVGNDDISRLTENVNAMLDRLDSALTTQRQLLEDVRHELRTPVTIVRGHLEVLDAEDSDQVAVTRAVAIRELDRMTRLIEEIESLADAQSATLVLRTVDVESFTTHMFEIAQGIPSRTWVLEGSGQGEVVMDAERVTQAWVQLVANAAKYSPEGSTVLIGSRVSPGEVEFWVSDTGPGIPPAARERIFERFGRVDQSRGSSGSGLGLAIVRAIVIAHGGRVTLISSDTGSRFGLVIPRTEGL